MSSAAAKPGPDALQEPHYQTRYIPISDWNKYHVWPPMGGLRHLVFHASENGFNKVFRKIGSRVLIDEQAFFAWMDEQGRTGKPLKKRTIKGRRVLSGTERREVEDAIEHGALGDGSGAV